MSIFKGKTPNQKLFDAVAKANVNKVRKAIDAGADVNAISTSKTSPLDVVAQGLEYYIGHSGMYAGDLDRVFDLKLVWNELVLNNGQLHKYKDDANYNDGFTLNPKWYGAPLSKMKFNAPKKPKVV